MDARSVGPPGIPGYSGLTEIARTPAAVTYRAVDGAGRSVIVKVLQREARPAVRARFDYDQARLQELRGHPDIVTTVAHGYTVGNLPYLVMEELSGGSMADRVGSGMDGPGVLAIGVKIAGALESAHRRNLIHGDLRPEDILVTDDGEPHIADLGVALVTGYGPDRAPEPERVAHAAPEQFETHIPTHASDIYALGSVLYALLAGSPAFVRPGDTSPTAVAIRIAKEPVPDLRATGVPGPVMDVIEKAMAKNPADRWPSAEAMGFALQQAEVTLGLPITPMNVHGADLNPARPEVEDEPAPGPGPAGPGPGPGPGGPGAGGPPPGPKPAGGSKKGILIVAAILALLAVVGGALLVLGGGDDSDDEQSEGFERDEEDEDDDEETTTTTEDTVAPPVDLVASSPDATGTITLSRLARWDQENGASIDADGVVVPDLIAAAGSFAEFNDAAVRSTVAGVRVTVIPAELAFPSDPQALLDVVFGEQRDLLASCAAPQAPQAADVAGFAGLRQRLDDCSGESADIFAGVDAAGRKLVVEVHLVEQEDIDAVDAVYASIAIA